MKKLAQTIVLLLVVGATIAPSAWSASPCDGVDRSLMSKTKSALAPEIARQLHAQRADVLQSFRFEGWSIIYVDSHEADNAFLFYSHDPLRSHYVTLWSGAAMGDEGSSIKDWTLKNAPGIPSKLAACFAWYVTEGRVM